MHFMYVDESGDPGKYDPTLPAGKRSSSHYSLTGFILPAAQWRNYLSAVVDIRRNIKQQYGLAVRAELHGAELINPRGGTLYAGLGGRFTRVALYRSFLQQVTLRLADARLINVYFDKTKTRSSTFYDDCERVAWERLIERYQMFLARSASNSLGIIFADSTNEVKLRKILRQKRVFNPVSSHFGGSRQAPVINIIEDPVLRASHHSYFVQIADLATHALYRQEQKKGSLRRYNVDKLFGVLAPLFHLPAARQDSQGVHRP